MLASSLGCKSNFVKLISCKWPKFSLQQNFAVMLMLKVETASHDRGVQWKSGINNKPLANILISELVAKYHTDT